MIKIKNSSEISQVKDNGNNIVYEYKSIRHGVPYAPNNMPFGMPVYSYVAAQPIRTPQPPPIEMPEMNLPRCINYYADYGGCGYWRMIWPEYCLNIYNKAVISGLTCMVLDLRFYQGIKTIRMQRQATPVQSAFIKELTKAKSQFNYRIIYEVDDIVFKDDIPDYNRCKDAFVKQEIIDSILEIMGMMDEITVTCQYMKDYYINKTGNKKITVIPNYPPKFWLDRFYNKERIEKLYEKNKKRPRILYAGSGTHIDVTNRTGMKDDFAHVVDEIIKARKKFKFVWKGCYPLAVKPFIENGEMEYIDWSPLMDLPKSLYDIGCNASFAPLIDNVFNKSKSNIKMIESGAFGMPGVYQDLCTYQEAEFKFKSGSDLISQLENITSDFGNYMKYSENARKFTESLWLEDHISKYEALYTTEWGSKERQEKCPELIKLNPDQEFKRS
jgi:hypothetical protein